MTEIDVNNIPKHIAIIMDGNGRWAKKRNKPRAFGHSEGFKAIDRTVEACVKLGIKYLTVYAFSSENWNRPQDEVTSLMKILYEGLINTLDTFLKNDIQFNVIGDIDSLSDMIKDKINEVVEQTKSNKRFTLNVALSYGSRNEIVRAIKNIVQEVEEEQLTIEDINEEMLSSYLDTAKTPDPELLIRTSGVYRISNFLLWQISYTELFFTDTLWPDFDEKDLRDAIYYYQNTKRKFGKTSEQIR